MQIEIFKGRDVDIRDNCFGSINENKIEVLEFIFPERFRKLL